MSTQHMHDVYRVTSVIPDGQGRTHEKHCFTGNLARLNQRYPLTAPQDRHRPNQPVDGGKLSYYFEKQVNDDEWRPVDDPRTYEFLAELNGEGQGRLIVTDVALMLRPATAISTRFHPNCLFDVNHVSSVMDAGDRLVGDKLIWFINAPGMTAEEAATILDSIWAAYFDEYCLNKGLIEATVVYMSALGQSVRKRFGNLSGGVQATVYVYAKEWWQRSSTQVALGQPDWSTIVRVAAQWIDPVDSIAPDQLEDHLAQGFPSTQVDRLVIVRPSDSKPGFTLRGFRTKRSH